MNLGFEADTLTVIKNIVRFHPDEIKKINVK